MLPCYAHPQDAVDAAYEGDIIKVAAGTYTGVSACQGVTQVVYISKTLTLRGGYTTTNWTVSDPDSNPTTLDAQGQGRVLYITGNISPTIEGLRITGGDAEGLGGDQWEDDAGGGVYIITATATIRNNQIFSNAPPYRGVAYRGGALFLHTSRATLTGNTIASNTAVWGGGLYLYDSGATLTSNTIISNTAKFDGGGLYLYDSDVTLTGNIVISNTATAEWGDGGGLCLYDSDAILIGNTIISNTAAFSGGGLDLYDSDATLTGNTIASNTAGYGGGLDLYGSDATLTDNTITSNTATVIGGGLCLGDDSDATLTGNTIVSNIAAHNGGGLYLYNSDATLISNTVISNTAKWDGSGAFLEFGDARLTSNTVAFNTANRDGGGLYLWYSDATLTNNMVFDNEGNSAGSGLYVYASSCRLLHTTLARNSGGDGSGVYVIDDGDDNYSAVALTNTILVSHSVGITVTAGNTATLEGTLWYGNGQDTGGAGTILTGTVNVSGDPAFVDPDAGDYHISSGSAAIDTGVDAGVTTDIDGDPRPDGCWVDIGADEYYQGRGCHRVYLPLIVKDVGL